MNARVNRAHRAKREKLPNVHTDCLCSSITCRHIHATTARCLYSSVMCRCFCASAPKITPGAASWKIYAFLWTYAFMHVFMCVCAYMHRRLFPETRELLDEEEDMTGELTITNSEIASSLSLQMLLYFNVQYSLFWGLITLSLMVFSVRVCLMSCLCCISQQSTSHPQKHIGKLPGSKHSLPCSIATALVGLVHGRTASAFLWIRWQSTRKGLCAWCSGRDVQLLSLSLSLSIFSPFSPLSLFRYPLLVSLSSLSRSLSLARALSPTCR